MKIGSVPIQKTAALAPMAGVADRAFRETCVEQGASYTVAEMCSAKGLTYGSERSEELLYTSPEEQPCAIQLFGDDPEIMAKAVQLTLPFSPLIIDLNMGCPAPKVTNNNCGSALMKNLPLAEEIIQATVEASPVPVTVKFRKGWDFHSVNAVELAQRAERAGASAIALHGRTRSQMYAFPVDWEIIKEAKQAVSIPVIGNGGITTPQEAKEMYDLTGCDLIMVGQGALGRPWVFQQIKAYLEEGILLPDPSIEEKLAILYHQVEKAVSYKGETMALRQARTHVAWYLKGFHGASKFRQAAGTLSTLEDLRLFLLQVQESLADKSQVL